MSSIQILIRISSRMMNRETITAMSSIQILIRISSRMMNICGIWETM